VLRLADTSGWQVETTDLTELSIVQIGGGAAAWWPTVASV